MQKVITVEEMHYFGLFVIWVIYVSLHLRDSINIPYIMKSYDILTL